MCAPLMKVPSVEGGREYSCKWCSVRSWIMAVAIQCEKKYRGLPHSEKQICIRFPKEIGETGGSPSLLMPKADFFHS